MKKVIFRYGAYSVATIVGLSILGFLLFRQIVESSESFGYLTMLLAMVFVFFGLKHYRDHVNGGLLSFGEGLKLGFLMVLFPAVGFGLFDILYSRVINPSWAANYTAKMTANMNAAQKAEFAKQMELFSNPVLEFAIMAATVLIIGIIVTIISTLALMRKPRKQLG